MAQDVHDLIEGKITELAWIQFRESAKTSFAKALVLYLICFRLDDYINVDSYEKENAERILYDVVWELQSNSRIKDDFGNIYNVQKTKDYIAQRRIGNFVTNSPPGETGIRVEAHSTQEPVRGRLHGSKRPGLVILDDFEVNKTIRSEAYTEAIRQHIQEFKGGIDTVKGRVLYLGQYLSEFANVQGILERAKIDDKLRVRMVPIADEDGPTWPEKYALTEEKGKVSIEAIKKRMWSLEAQDDDFMAEMMCRPIDFSNSEFKREWFGDKNRYLTPDLDDLSLNTNICFDNAPSTSKYSDWIGCTIVSIDTADIWYVRYVKRYRLNTPDLIEEMFELFKIWKPTAIGFEQKAFKDLIEPYIIKRSKELGIYPYVVELKDEGRRKEDRIRGRLQGRLKTGMIKFLTYATDDTNALVKEFADFPNGKFDDLMDSLQYHTEVATAPPEAMKRGPVTMAEHKRADIKEAHSAYERRKNENETPDTI